MIFSENSLEQTIMEVGIDASGLQKDDDAFNVSTGTYLSGW